MKASNSRYSTCVYFASGALARKVERLASEAWQPVGLSPSHGYLLLMVIDEPGIQPNRLVKELLLSPSTITRLTDKLEAKELVRRTAEGKVIKIYPTAKAQSLEPQMKECMSCFADKYADILNEEDSLMLTGVLNKVTDKLTS